jgi:formate hydrogenlyase subunit 6/NADH:ubiquinone oxidoreductase subunit I
MPYFQMTRLALKWALTKPPTTQYPFEPRRAIAGSRGELIFKRDNCAYCTLCAKRCPTGAIEVDRAQKRFTLDRLRCISCACCVENCPRDSLSLSTGHGTPSTTMESYFCDQGVKA